MAPTDKIARKQPGSLPADFSGWDSGQPPATLPADFAGFDDAPVSSAAPEPPAQPAKAQAAVSRVVGRSPDTTTSRAPAKVRADAEKLSVPLQSNRANIEGGLKRRTEGKSKHKMIVALCAVGVILLLLILIPLNYHEWPFKTAMVKQSDVQQPATALTMPSPALTELSPARQQPATQQPTTTPTEAVPPPAVRSEMMNNQLTAPTRIPHNIKTVAEKGAPPSSSFGATGMEGLSGNSGGAASRIFSGQARLKVNAETPKKVSISGGVEAGLLIYKTTPVYPPFAKTARVSGIVVLQATISKTGSIEGVHVVSGPVMLRQAAMDAVRTWRYKPYKVNNEPVEVETTVNVNFVLD
jgi:protein TonB